MFEEEHNVRVNYDIFADNEELLAKIQPGNPGYDIIVPSDYMVEIMIEQGLLMELDESQIPNLSNLDPQFADPPYDPGDAHCVAYQWGTQGLGYNFAEVGREIDSWEVMFSGEFAGRISWLTDARSVIGTALIYLGYNANTTNEAEIDEALQLLLDTKDDVVAFAPDTGQILLDSGEVDIAFEYSGDIFQIMEENEDIRYVIPREGSIIWTDNMCIPVGAPHPDIAHEFIDFILDAENGAALSNYTAYGTPNAASLPMIDEEYRNDPAIYPPDDVRARLYFIESVGEADVLYNDAWTRLGVGQ
jgi:spermidine/putrescine transport system substrate-binding protein